MNVYSSPNSDLFWEPTTQRLLFVWRSSAKKLNEDDVQTEFHRLLSFVKQYGAKSIVVDGKLYPYYGNFDLQGWIDFEFLRLAANAGIIRVAMIANPNEIDVLKKEKLFESSELKQEYFHDIDAAIHWADKSN